MAVKTKNEIMVPFLKWPGGKRWFVESYADLVPKQFVTYFEPFLGAGAMFFHLQPARAVLADVNPDLIAAFNGIKSNFRYIVRSLNYHQRRHSNEHYYRVRNMVPRSDLQRASRMIYLNRTCFNGIYRVNKEGRFNVPIGSKTNVILPSDNFEAVASLLANANIIKRDFEETIGMARRGDFIFADPPYTVRHNLNGFIKYNENLFSWSDQERLAKVLLDARARGVRIVLTNANHSSIRELYRDSGFEIRKVSRFSALSAASENRKQYEELVIISK
jgi:DNA adenine methylase